MGSSWTEPRTDREGNIIIPFPRRAKALSYLGLALVFGIAAIALILGLGDDPNAPLVAIPFIGVMLATSFFFLRMNFGYYSVDEAGIRYHLPLRRDRSIQWTDVHSVDVKARNITLVGDNEMLVIDGALGMPSEVLDAVSRHVPQQNHEPYTLHYQVRKPIALALASYAGGLVVGALVLAAYSGARDILLRTGIALTLFPFLIALFWFSDFKKITHERLHLMSYRTFVALAVWFSFWLAMLTIALSPI